jgi:hypothetical protein
MSIFTKYNGDIFSHNSRVVLDGGIVESLDYLNEVSEETKRITILPLEYYGKIKTAFSIRKVFASYNGACLRVRRSSDNTELNIGFFNNELDIITLLNFVGSGDGFVTTWYDQSGGNLHLTQTNTTAQPVIVSGGTLVNVNGKVAIDFDGINDGLFSTGTISNYNSENVHIICVFKTKNTIFTDANKYVFNCTSDTNNRYALFYNRTSYNLTVAFTKSGFITARASPNTFDRYCLTNCYNTPIKTTLNGNEFITAGSGNGFATPSISVAIRADNTLSAPILAQEFIIYNYVQLNASNLLEQSINSYYKIY